MQKCHLHWQYDSLAVACMLHSMDRRQETHINVRCSVQETVHRIVKEAVDLEHEFCCTALPVSLVGMNAALMGQYIEYVADRLLIELGCEKLYNSLNPFDWMEMISLQVHQTPHLCLLLRCLPGF